MQNFANLAKSQSVTSCSVMRLCYWQGNEFAIHRSRVWVLGTPLRSGIGLGQATYTRVTLCHQYKLVPAKGGDLLGWENNRSP